MGYQLTKPLRFKYKEGIFFVLNEGYVWDGASYPNILKFLIGDKKLESVLAGSALHDARKKIPTRYIGKDFNSGVRKIKYTNMSMSDGARFYKKTIDIWPIKEEKINSFQSTIQMVFLKLLHPLYLFFSTDSDWTIHENNLK